MKCCNCFRRSKDKDTDSNLELDQSTLKHNEIQFKGLKIEILLQDEKTFFKTQAVDAFITGCTTQYNLRNGRQVDDLKIFLKSDFQLQTQQNEIEIGTTRTFAIPNNMSQKINYLITMCLPLFRNDKDDAINLRRAFDYLITSIQEKQMANVLIGDFATKDFGFPRNIYFDALQRFVNQLQQAHQHLQTLFIVSTDDHFIDALIRRLKGNIVVKRLSADEATLTQVDTLKSDLERPLMSEKQ